MKFRYYITDLFDGIIKGTNNPDVAKNYADSGGDWFVLDSETGHMLTDTNPVEVLDAEAKS